MIGTMANPRFRADRLVELMRKRDLNAGQLAYLTGVSQPMVFYLTRDERPGVSAVIAAKLARALGCSVEYLLGMTEEPSPQTLDIDDLVMELAEIANRLTNRRQRDLLMQARSYLEAARTPPSPEQLMSDLLDLIAEAGGEQSREQLVALLMADLDGSLPALEEE